MLKSLKKIAKSQDRQTPVLIGFDENPVSADGSKTFALKNSSPHEVREPPERCYIAKSFMQTFNSETRRKINPTVQSEADCHNVTKKIGNSNSTCDLRFSRSCFSGNFMLRRHSEI